MKNSIFSRKLQTAIRLAPHQRARVMRARLQDITGPIRRALAAPIARAFHVAYYDDPDTWAKNSWMGTPIQQFPSDLYLYQQIIAHRCPDFIIQTGVFDGGSALFLAHMLDLAGAPSTAKVIAIDITLRPLARALAHPRIHLIEGSSTAPLVVAQIESLLSDIPLGNGGMVSLDSDHSAHHVARELEIYPRFVGVGNYLVVEDTNVNGHPVLPSHGPGPREAMNDWLLTPRTFKPTGIEARQHFSAHSWLMRV